MLRKLVPLTDKVLSRQPDVVFLEIGCNEIGRVAPFVLAEQVFQFAKILVACDELQCRKFFWTRLVRGTTW